VRGASYCDAAKTFKHSLLNLRYWTWFFSWWSAWDSLLTIIWAIISIYQWLTKKKANSYLWQLFELTVAITNFVSFFVFAFGGFVLTKPANSVKITYPLVKGEIKAFYVWLFYNLFWHFLAPLTYIGHYLFFAEIDQVVEKQRKTFLDSLLNPIVYSIYVFARPLILNTKDSLALAHTYPRDYPYPFFFWMVGLPASSSEQKKQIKFFWHQWKHPLPIIFWNFVIVNLSFVVIYCLSSWLVNWRKKIINWQQKQEVIFNLTALRIYPQFQRQLHWL
jgi:hypothetical protein